MMIQAFYPIKLLFFINIIFAYNLINSDFNSLLVLGTICLLSNIVLVYILKIELTNEAIKIGNNVFKFKEITRLYYWRSRGVAEAQIFVMNHQSWAKSYESKILLSYYTKRDLQKILKFIVQQNKDISLDEYLLDLAHYEGGKIKYEYWQTTLLAVLIAILFIIIAIYVG